MGRRYKVLGCIFKVEGVKINVEWSKKSGMYHDDRKDNNRGERRDDYGGGGSGRRGGNDRQNKDRYDRGDRPDRTDRGDRGERKKRKRYLWNTIVVDQGQGVLRIEVVHNIGYHVVRVWIQLMNQLEIRCNIQLSI